MSDSIGARLRQARELRRLTIPQVSETTKLRTHYLQALESDDYSAIPSAAQARGFLRIYAQFLELDLAELLPAPAAPAEPAPAQAASTVSKPVPATPAPSLFDGLRKRLSRPKKEGGGQELPLSVPTGLPAVPTETPVSGDAATAAVSEAQTVRRPKTDSQEVKKNEPV